MQPQHQSQVPFPLGLWRSSPVPPVLGCAQVRAVPEAEGVEGLGEKLLEQGEGVSSRFEVRAPAEPLRGGEMAQSCSGTSSSQTSPFWGQHPLLGWAPCTAGAPNPIPAASWRHKALVLEAEQGWLLLSQFLFLEKLLRSARTSILVQAGASLLCTWNYL